MIIMFFFMYFVVSCLPPLHFAISNCPEFFVCPNHPPFRYPFYNASNTECGLIEVDCTTSGGEIQLGGQSHVILSKLDSNSLIIRNSTFENLVKEEHCEALMDNFTSPSPLLFSLSIISPNITLFKCKKNLSYTRVTDSYFEMSNFSHYNKCKDYNFYYTHPYTNSGVPSDLPHICQVIRLPLKKSWQFVRENPDKADIFYLLPSNFSISFSLSASCERCLKNDSHCQNKNGMIRCSDVITGAAENPDQRITEILGVVIVLLVTLIKCLIKQLKQIIMIYWLWLQKRKSNVNVDNFLKNHEFLAPKKYSYSQVKKLTNSFKIKLGQGGFGSVYKGELSNGNLVAVKVLNQLKGNNGEDFINEVASVGRTSHVNIVSLVGFCCDGRHRALIYEFMPNGSLEKFIYGRESSSNIQIGWEKLHQIAIGIARGLEYLHKGCSTRILHFDIKPHNILLDQDFCPKISDFGLAKLFLEKRSMISLSHMRGTPGYIAPELFSINFGRVSQKSDVYSYGMMVLEMVGGRKNIEVDVDHTSEIYFPHWMYKKIEVDEEQLGLHGIVSDEENKMVRKMIIVGLWCIQTNPLNRPTITKVLEMLEDDLASLEIPPKPYLFSPTRSINPLSIDNTNVKCSFVDSSSL
uniref:LEAF RUST 10 DISEASE-RESISTANCE LOCUS RECEPTOR-LIKE PROTEIN KINASE-like 2.5 isoform X2 n=1 Tax=Erigeron canadensis TaxID=72917 RepID=UPI001CB96307|nr:LEAF RUST 10 DISEASE-RESISTANCE LOCUS RECEPTOR-LIKE PROTEIN KINASE-like 2.5 isoform X2 [Erigeron canadensis]